jgi:transcription elongation factor
MRNDNIKDIVEQLQRLQLQQDALITRLGELSNNSVTTNARATRIPPETETITARTFAIGDKVRIRNPNRLQADRGVVVNITANRITVQTRRGSKIVCAPHNILFDDE